jgi:hypothetical protein
MADHAIDTGDGTHRLRIVILGFLCKLCACAPRSWEYIHAHTNGQRPSLRLTFLRFLFNILSLLSVVLDITLRGRIGGPFPGVDEWTPMGLFIDAIRGRCGLTRSCDAYPYFAL